MCLHHFFLHVWNAPYMFPLERRVYLRHQNLNFHQSLLHMHIRLHMVLIRIGHLHLFLASLILSILISQVFSYFSKTFLNTNTYHLLIIHYLLHRICYLWMNLYMYRLNKRKFLEDLTPLHLWQFPHNKTHQA